VCTLLAANVWLHAWHSNLASWCAAWVPRLTNLLDS
jgi:hypothetical protein